MIKDSSEEQIKVIYCETGHKARIAEVDNNLGAFQGLVGGWIVVEWTQIIPPPSYITGIKAFWNGFYVFYSCFKMSLFCFLISSIAAFNGYYAKGGSLGVGKSSTRSIVVTSILILMFDLIVTQLMLY